MTQNYSIMLVGEEVDTFLDLKKSLDDRGYNIEMYANPVEALNKIKNDKYHIVLTDIMLVEMDGISLLKEIKCYDALTQVIMLTDCSTIDKVIQSLELGASDYILKPIKSPEYVIEIIESAIRKLERWRACIKDIIINHPNI